MNRPDQKSNLFTGCFLHCFNAEGDYPERAMYPWAKEYSSALLAGQGYSALPRTIIISIINFKPFDCGEYYSEFKPLEVTRHTLLPDKLPKLPSNVREDNMLLLWLSLFKAETGKDLEKIKAINPYYTITASSEFQEKERLRAQARHDEAQALHYAEHKARSEQNLEIARNLLGIKLPIDQIVSATGLTRDEVEGFLNAD